MALRPGDSLAVVPLRMLRSLPSEFVKKHTETNSIGETLTEDYTLVMLQLHQMGHAVQFVSRAEWMRMLYSSDFTAWREKLWHVDVVLAGYWPYECAAPPPRAATHYRPGLAHLSYACRHAVCGPQQPLPLVLRAQLRETRRHPVHLPPSGPIARGRRHRAN